MLGIGWVMFWKAMVVPVAVACWDSWQAFKKRRISSGLPLKQCPDGVYRPDDWPDRWERRAIRTAKVAGAFFLAYGVLVVYFLLTVPTDELFR